MRSESRQIDLVVAHYQEALNWLKRVPRSIHIHVYHKGSDNLPEGIVLPNIGREAHTYLHHIVSHYDSLACWTFFCQGHPFDHEPQLHRLLREAVEGQPLPADGFLWMGFLIDTDDAEGGRLFQRWSKCQVGERLDMKSFHRLLLGGEGPDFYRFRGGGQLALHRQKILKRPLSFYRRALEISATFPHAAHCFERSWDRFFGIPPIPASALPDGWTRYDKPIKRLCNNTGCDEKRVM